MSGSSEIIKHIYRRIRLASYESEMIARSRDVLSRSEALLQEAMPTTFLGKRHYPPPPAQPAPLAQVVRGRSLRDTEALFAAASLTSASRAPATKALQTC